MSNYAKSYLVLLVQKVHRIFCYYNISTKTIEAFENIHGINSWNSSQTLLILYYLNDNLLIEKAIIPPPIFNNNWYFDIPEDMVTAYVKLYKILPGGIRESILTSNSITTPRDHISEDSSVYYIDINNPAIIINSTEPLHNSMGTNSVNLDKVVPFRHNFDETNSDYFIETMRNLNFEDVSSSK